MTTTQLNFWVENENLYATLAHMAQDILIIPASSTPVERFFPKLSMHQVVEEPIDMYKLRE